jgi:hypothetical protein
MGENRGGVRWKNLKNRYSWSKSEDDVEFHFKGIKEYVVGLRRGASVGFLSM